MRIILGLAVLVVLSMILSGDSGAEARARKPVYIVKVTESFHCTHAADFCSYLIPYEGDAINHESAVLYDDGTGHTEFTLHCRADAEFFCSAGTTAHFSEDYNWFIDQADCGELGCVPLDGPCVPDEFQTCTPYFWREAPETWTMPGCVELAPDLLFECARKGSPAVALENPIEGFGGSYPDMTFWPAVPGHYTFNNEPFGGCFDFPVDHCPPPGINVQYQIVQLN